MVISNENIKNAVEQADELLKIHNIDRHQRQLYSLLIEEALLAYRDKGASDFKFMCKNIGKEAVIRLVIPGDKYDVLNQSEGSMVYTLINQIDKAPEWHYKHGRNVIICAPTLILPSSRSFKFIWSYMDVKSKRTLFGALALYFVQLIINVTVPLMTAMIIVAYSNSEINKIIMVAGLILAEGIVEAILSYFVNIKLLEAYKGILINLQVDVTKKTLGISTESIDENGSGVFIQRLSTDTQAVVNSFNDIIILSSNVIQMVALIISLAIISYKVMFIQLVIFAGYIAIQKLREKAMDTENREFALASERNTGLISEMVRAHRSIKLLHAESNFEDTLTESFKEVVTHKNTLRGISSKYIRYRTEYMKVMNFIYMAILAYYMACKSMPPSIALVLFNYNGQFINYSSYFANYMSIMQTINLSTERLYQLMHSRDFPQDTFGTEHLDYVKGDFELQNVGFSYTHKGGKVQVLNEMNLSIKAGQSVAFVGRSGCGKSTILNLMSRLYDPQKGVVLLDGVNIRSLDQDTLRKSIAMVDQSPYIFNMSVKDNLRIIKDDITDEEMIDVCKTACIHEDILKFPEGYDTIIGEGGINISGGQRQRLALARCLLRNYPVIMLDEATSALDNVTQSQIKSAIEGMQGKHTIIMVAHRLSTVVGCERIFFIQDGTVKAQGSHLQLLENCPEYRVLYQEETGN